MATTPNTSQPRKRRKVRYALMAGFALVAAPFSLYSTSILNDATASDAFADSGEEVPDSASTDAQGSRSARTPAGQTDYAGLGGGVSGTPTLGDPVLQPGLSSGEEAVVLAYGDSPSQSGVGIGFGPSTTGQPVAQYRAGETLDYGLDRYGGGAADEEYYGPLPLNDLSPGPEKVSP